MTDSEDELPPEREVKDFTFKQMRKIRMFEVPESLPTPRCSLLAVSSKFGLTFVGCPTGVKVIKTETIETINESVEGSMQNVVQHCKSSFIEIGHSVRFVGLSGDHLTLSVCYENGNNKVMALFDVPTLWSTNNSDAKFGETMLSSDAGVSIVNLVWNPVVVGLFAVCLSSGSVSIMELTNSEVKTRATLPEDLKASAICWSPKGKQLVVGHKDGKLTQYSQTLEVKKEIRCPELFTDDPHLVADVLWIASKLFAVVYSSFEEGDTPKFQLISTENEPLSMTNFDDIYYVMSEEREPVFYMKNLTDWNMVVSATSNGLEAAVVGKYGGEAPWEKWSFEEDSRPVMPLTNDNDDTFPMGLEIDFSSIKQITKGEGKLPPAPILMILSTDGVLCPFYILNQTPNANHSIVHAPERMAPGGKRKSVVSKMSDMSQETVGEAPKQKGSLKLGSFSLGACNQTIPESLSQGSTGSPLLAGSLSLGNSKQPSAGTLSSGTPTSVGPSTFSFVGPKPLVSTVASGAFAAASSSAFAVTGQKPSGLMMAFKLLPSQQLPSEGSAKPSAALPQLIKPTPTSQVQSSFPAPSFQSPGSLSIAGTTRPVLAQGVSLGGDKPKVMSSAPSQVASQGMIAQPKPTPAQLAATVAKPLPVLTPPAATVTNPPTVSNSSTMIRKPTPAVQTVIEPVAAKPEPQREKSNLSGFRLPGQSSVTVASKQEATKKTASASVSKDNVVEASVSENIREVISQFNEEMAKLSDSVKSMQSKCALAKDNEELDALRKETGLIGRTLVAINDTTKEQQKDIDEEKKKILEAFEMLEDARIRQERKNDPRYVQLLKSRALDPVNTSKMRDIRNLQFYLDKTLREVNMVLDEQWNKENERQRSMQRPALDEIYQTLRINYKIAQDQGVKLEKITEEMKNRKILSTSWQRSSVNTFMTRGDAASMSTPFAVPKEELKLPSQRTPVPISPEKQAQLRSMFQKRRSTPVRRSTLVPSPAAKSPTVRPIKPQVPCYSSTPAAKPDFTEERTKETISLIPPVKEQENESECNVGDVGSRWKEETQSVKDEQQEDEQEEEQELKQLSEVSNMSSSGPPTSLGGFSLPDRSSPRSTATDESEGTKTTDHSVRNDVGVGLQARPASQPAAVSGAFSSFNPPGLQSTLITTQAEPSKTSGGFFLPPSNLASTTSNNENAPSVQGKRTEVPPNIAAGMAAMSRASAAQDVVQQSNSKLDPSASIEPVTLVAYKPQTQGGEQATDLDKENNAAKAIANAALMAATAEAKKPSTKPQCSTEFVFKSSEEGKPGPPVVTFKPPNTLSQASQSGFTVAPNVTVFKPAFGPIASSSSTQSTSGGLQGSLTAAQTAIPPGQATISTVPFSFSTPASGLFAFAPSSASPNLSSTSGNTKTSASSVSTAASASVAGITPSARVSRNLFASGDSTSQTARTSQQQDQSKQATTTATTASSSIVCAAGVTTLATTTTTFSISASAPSKGGFFKTLGPPGNSGSAFGPSNLGSGSTRILDSLMRSSNAGTSGTLFAAVTTTGSAPSSIAPLIQLKPTSPEKKDESAKITSAPSSITASPAGMFQQALSESNKVATITTVNTVNTLPLTTSILGASATTTASAPGSLFGIPSKTGVIAPSTTSSSSNLFGLSAGSQSSAFSSTTIASPFFTNINPASTKPSASTEGYSSSTEGSSTSVSGGMFGKATSTTSAFGPVSTVASVGFGSLGTATTTSAGGGLFGTSSTTAFAPTSIFGTSSSANTFNISQPFTSPVNTKGSSFGTRPAFGSVSTTAGTISTFGASLATSKPTFGQSSFAPTTSAGFGQATSKPAENALGFGFSGFGLGGQGSSQTNKTNPFGVSQGFSSPAASQPSLFGGKSAADVFKASETPKPAFGSVSFPQSGFGSQSSGAFSGGSFSSQGGGVLASGFGFGGGASSTGVSAAAAATGFGSPQPFASPSSAGGSVFGGAPSFGSSPAFGGAPTFGGSPQAPSFGSTPSQGIFGGGKSGGFGQSSGSPTSGSPTFGALASQPNVPTFGSLSGQCSPSQRFGTTQPSLQQQSPFSSFGGASQNPSGVSFSQWR